YIVYGYLLSFKSIIRGKTRKFVRYNEERDETCSSQYLRKVDLVFIPIVASGHYYLLYINFMKGSLELIDNTLLDNKISFVQKYKNHPRTLLRAFATF
ncbi:putative manganese-transporting ATPase PDR2, partial [Bienertia sinuspersici]